MPDKYSGVADKNLCSEILYFTLQYSRDLFLNGTNIKNNWSDYLGFGNDGKISEQEYLQHLFFLTKNNVLVGFKPFLLVPKVKIKKLLEDELGGLEKMFYSSVYQDLSFIEGYFPLDLTLFKNSPVFYVGPDYITSDLQKEMGKISELLCKHAIEMAFSNYKTKIKKDGTIFVVYTSKINSLESYHIVKEHSAILFEFCFFLLKRFFTVRSVYYNIYQTKRSQENPLFYFERGHCMIFNLGDQIT